MAYRKIKKKTASLDFRTVKLILVVYDIWNKIYSLYENLLGKFKAKIILKRWIYKN